MSRETKSRKPRTHRSLMAAGASPEPMGMSSEAACGHSACGDTCHVRYVGATSRIHDHYAIHAARGMTHVWSAAVITGLAVVLTGAIAFSSAQARTPSVPTTARDTADMAQLRSRLQQMEQALRDLRDVCAQRNAVVPNPTIALPPSTLPIAPLRLPHRATEGRSRTP